MDKVPKMSTGVFFAIGLGTMMTAFESSAVGAALPAMVHSFHGAIPTGKWIITGYLLALWQD